MLKSMLYSKFSGLFSMNNGKSCKNKKKAASLMEKFWSGIRNLLALRSLDIIDPMVTIFNAFFF